MGDIRLAVVNGTGPAGEVYDNLMERSFCHQLAGALGERAFYHRGPHLLGLDVREEAMEVYHWLRAAYVADPATRLMLAGYSRGGSAAIMACELLERDGIPVDSLFLFDAVARHEFSHGKVIPANVKFSRHARRCHAAAFIEKYEGTLRRASLLGGIENPIRPEFGNTGLIWRGDGDHQPAEVFLGSHGAMGGVGWQFVVEDGDCERKVASWMNTHLEARGVGVELQPYDPPNAVTPAHPSAFERWLADNIYQFTIHGDETVYTGLPGAAPQPPAADLDKPDEALTRQGQVQGSGQPHWPAHNDIAQTGASA